MRNFHRRRPNKEQVHIELPPVPLSPQHGPLPSGLSSPLMALLSITMRDGFVNLTSFSMLKDIYPYVSRQDRVVIDNLMGYRNMASDLATKGPGQ